MKIIIGTYRKRAYIDRALDSIDQYVSGGTELVFIDDSGDAENAAYLSQYGKVIETGAKGYGVAMTAACVAAEGETAMWWEEDFEALTDINLDEMAEILYHRPYLAQVALLRGPHFPIEHEYGGLIEALQAKGHKFTDVHGVIEQTATFTANPSVWRGPVWAASWPRVRWSEDRKRDQLLQQGYRFGYLPGIRVAHDGERTGHGY